MYSPSCLQSRQTKENGSRIGSVDFSSIRYGSVFFSMVLTSRVRNAIRKGVPQTAFIAGHHTRFIFFARSMACLRRSCISSVGPRFKASSRSAHCSLVRIGIVLGSITFTLHKSHWTRPLIHHSPDSVSAIMAELEMFHTPTRNRRAVSLPRFFALRINVLAAP